MRAYKNFNKFDTQQPFWQWIATITNNHCLDLLRSRNRSKHIFGDEVEETEQLASLEIPIVNQLIANQDNEAVNNAVALLPDKYRVPLVLAYFSQISYDEIAQQLDISRNHVGVLLLRAKKQLRKNIVDANETKQGSGS